MPTDNAVRTESIELAYRRREALFPMTSVLISILATLQGLVRSRAALHLEVLALRHQLQVLERSRPRRVRLTEP